MSFTESDRLLLIAIHRRLNQVNAVVTTLADEIAALMADVANETAVDQSAIALINGIPTLIQNAVAKALAAGATPDQLTALSNLAIQIGANASGLAAAVTANTPAAPTPSPAPTPTPATGS